MSEPMTLLAVPTRYVRAYQADPIGTPDALRIEAAEYMEAGSPRIAIAYAARAAALEVDLPPEPVPVEPGQVRRAPCGCDRRVMCVDGDMVAVRTDEGVPDYDWVPLSRVESWELVE